MIPWSGEGDFYHGVMQGGKANAACIGFFFEKVNLQMFCRKIGEVEEGIEVIREMKKLDNAQGPS